MNSMGNLCRSVVVLVDTARYASPLLDKGSGHHLGCVVGSAGRAPSARDIVQQVEYFCEEKGVDHRVVTISEAAMEISDMRRASTTAAEWLASPLTLIDCTPAAGEEQHVASLLAWLYEMHPPGSYREGGATEVPYTLVAVLDTARGAPCPPPAIENASAGSNALAWLLPTPSYYSELMESAGASAHSHFVFPVHMYSRYPILRDRGLQAWRSEGGETAPVPLAAWANTCTLGGLLRELAFKAGRLAKYGA
ncbi:hypothetical protein LSCM1_01608 [Leishmania martiniquensis]|uniref:Uncharacterized protein n=1 Tax=Leishmania martiniquensis TaxID=1580590 RepID=A0A836KI30_9TRYP|nr:hypothetical protein LSCM1_01608 [Leishmania martiniquensis]